jgi:hypothetical protein
VIVSTGAYFHISARIDFAAKGSKYDENIPVTGHIKFEYMLYLKKKIVLLPIFPEYSTISLVAT